MPRDNHIDEDYTCEDSPPPIGSGWVLAAFTALLAVGIIHGVLAFGCYLVNEHRRLSSFEIAVLWLGDLIGLFWFLRYAVRWQLGDTNPHPQPLESTKLPRTVWIMLGSMVFGFLGELTMTISLVHEESVAFERAVPAVCTLNAAKAQIAKGAATYWKLDGQYRDAAGDVHPVTYYLRASDDLPRLPAPLSSAIRQNQMPLDLPIVYDPTHPGRSWIPQLGWDDGNRLHYFSFVILLFQFLISFLFVAVLHQAIKQERHLPWWTELHNLIPLGTQAFIMALFGGLEFYMVRRFCP